MKVLHGMVEVAGQNIYAVKGLKSIGISAETAVYEPNKFQYEYDHNLGINRKEKIKYPLYALKVLCFYIYSMFKYDVFHYHFGKSICFNYDLKLSKMFKKKIFFEFHGTDIRDYQIAAKTNRYLEPLAQPRAKARNKNLQRIFDNHVNYILHDVELRKYLPVDSNCYYVPLKLEVHNLAENIASNQGEKIIIVHAPSNRLIKGTDVIIETVDRLSKKYDIEFILVENMTQEAAKKVYASADIIVDQLRLGTYGCLAIEAMALGKPVISYVMPEMVKESPEDLPVVIANTDNFEEQLIMLLENESLRNELGEKGICYAMKYHDYRKVAILLKQIYEGKAELLSCKETFEYVANIKI